MEKRYQIFVSSTFSDLKEERKEVIEALLNAKHIPAGMEMFSASNEEQFKYIKKIIDNCDYYILIIAARYGSINQETGISFTEQEYEYAVSKKIPVLAFLHVDPYNLPVEKREEDKKKKLEAFREKVSANRMCRMWHTTSDLVSSVIISLIEEIDENPQSGWVRGGSYDTTELLEQINSLRIEKEKLENEVKRLTQEINDNRVNVEGLACGNDKFTINGTKYDRYASNDSAPYSVELSWDEIFSAIGPYLVAAKNYIAFSEELRRAINSAYDKLFTRINDDCIQTIKTQLQALGLIIASPGKATTGGYIEFITLTNKGSNYLIRLKSIKKS